MPRYRVKLTRRGHMQIEDWFARSGRSVPRPATRDEEIRNQVSFANYDLERNGFKRLRATPVADEFIIDDVLQGQMGIVAGIVGYHGFELMASR